MNARPSPLSSWRQLQTELRDLAFLLDRQGSYASAELVVSLAADIDELLSGAPAGVERSEDEIS